MKLLTPRKSLSDAWAKRNAFDFWNWGSVSINIPPQSWSVPISLQSNVRHAGDLSRLLTMWKLKKFLAFKKKGSCLCPASSECFEVWSTLFFLPGQAFLHQGCWGSLWASPSSMSTSWAKLSHAVCSLTLSTGVETCAEGYLSGQGLKQGAFISILIWDKN